MKRLLLFSSKAIRILPRLQLNKDEGRTLICQFCMAVECDIFLMQNNTNSFEITTKNNVYLKEILVKHLEDYITRNLLSM
jgi:hypothetical protein